MNEFEARLYDDTKMCLDLTQMVPPQLRADLHSNLSECQTLLLIWSRAQTHETCDSMILRIANCGMLVAPK